jgi:hypothetical protein
MWCFWPVHSKTMQLRSRKFCVEAFPHLAPICLNQACKSATDVALLLSVTVPSVAVSILVLSKLQSSEAIEANRVAVCHDEDVS